MIFEQINNTVRFAQMLSNTMDYGLSLSPRNCEIKEIENLQLVDWY